ncbi:MAG: hypothetical protein DRO07_01275 [Candidatus Iainarchaeum archaeon]|uniref:Tyr recombinase domain-containing protein n=1 Tax=Candidatus Iainarchaeum sp. TaxID=3101447 RepID=A0A497JHP7_9ARCH|nr:MAG: hypothetical protein DRO07_01275 [Candidatus Diapherotrites archaeon]
MQIFTKKSKLVRVVGVAGLENIGLRSVARGLQGSETHKSIFKQRVVVGNEEWWLKFLYDLRKSDLEALTILCKDVIREKYPSKFKNSRKCRNVYMVFTDNDLIKFFSAIPVNRVKFGVLFFTQLLCGFRIGEACNIKLEDIDFEHQTISVFTEKARVRSDQPIPALLCEVLSEWITTNYEQITTHQNYIFFSANPFISRLVVSKDAARNVFTEIRKKAGLLQTYAEANDRGNPLQHKNRPLYKLSTHSLRRTYLTRLYQECKQKEMVRVLARHKKKEVTDNYIFFSHQEQLELVNRVFSREPFISIANNIIEKIKANKWGVASKNEN